MTVRPSHVPVPLFTLSSKANSGEKKRKKKTKHVTFRVYPTLLLIFVVLHSFLSVDSFLDLSFHFPFSFPETIYGFTRSFQIQPCNTGISHRYHQVFGELPLQHESKNLSFSTFLHPHQFEDSGYNFWVKQ